MLGLGFGMGTRKFMNTLRGDRAVAPLFEQGALDARECWRIVDDYRRQYSNVCLLWARLEAAFRLAIDGVESFVNRLHFFPVLDRTCQSGRAVHIQLPSGRCLRYPDARLEPQCRTRRYTDRYGLDAEFTPEGDGIVYGSNTSLYGGKIVENVVQATARDFLAEAILELERRGYTVVFHVHDEIVIEVAEAQRDQALAAMREVLSTPPTWALSLPLAAEVKATKRYDK